MKKWNGNDQKVLKECYVPERFIPARIMLPGVSVEDSPEPEESLTGDSIERSVS